MNRRKRMLADLDQDIRDHIELETQDNIARGMSPEDARCAALRKFSNVVRVKEDTRAVWSVVWFEQLVKDLHYAMRMLRKNPGFATVVVLTLALGIGANTAIFSIVNGVLLRPLPFADSNRLVMVYAADLKSGRADDVTSYPIFADWRAQAGSFQGLAAFSHRTITLSDNGETQLLDGLRVTPGFFEILKVAPALGRTFRPEEERAGNAMPAILNDAYWKEHFGGRSDVLGKTLRLAIGREQPQPVTIVGVMPPGFRFSPGEPEQIYIPVVEEPNRGHGWLLVVGRLRDGISISQAQAEVETIIQRLARVYPKTDSDTEANLQPLTTALLGNARIGLLIFLGVVSLVLLIACTNVANLLIARSAARQKELAVRAAMGAGRRRLIQQMLTESVILALAGGALGLAFATAGNHLFTAWLGRHFVIPRIETVHTDLRVMAFAFGLAILTGILFGIAPAFIASAPDVHEQLRESGRTSSAGPRSRRLRSALVISETALALVLLAGAGLLLKSLLIMRHNAPGFDTNNLVTVDMWLPTYKFSSLQARSAYFTSLLDRINSAPGVRSAALVADLPLGGGRDSLAFHIVGKPDPAPGQPFESNFNIVSPGYFQTMGTPLISGREFTSSDSATAPAVILVNQAAAKRFWPGPASEKDALGRQISLPSEQDPKVSVALTVIGVTADIRNRDLATPAKPEIFLDYLQPGPGWPFLVLVARTTQDATQLAPTIKTLASQVDHEVPFVRVRTMDEVLSGSMAQPQVYAILIGASALLALVLAAIGIYGIVAYAAAQRTHEIGIRFALGASRTRVLSLMLQQGLSLALSGLIIGVLASLGANRLLTRLVPSIHPGDPLTILAVSAILLCVALSASLVPAWRVSRIDPLTALRYE